VHVKTKYARIKQSSMKRTTANKEKPRIKRTIANKEKPRIKHTIANKEKPSKQIVIDIIVKVQVSLLEVSVSIRGSCEPLFLN